MTLDAALAELVRDAVADGLASLAPAPLTMTAAAAADALNVSPSTVRRWVREGRLGALDGYSNIVIPRIDVEALVMASAVTASPVSASAREAADGPAPAPASLGPAGASCPFDGAIGSEAGSASVSPLRAARQAGDRRGPHPTAPGDAPPGAA